jgi:hypothetical protein
MRMARNLALTIVGVALVTLTGCASGPTPDSLAGPCCGLGAIPTDLPANPDPCQKYCRVWVPAEYRKVPKLVKCKASCTRTVEVPIKVMRAYEVQVKPRTGYCASTCGKDCEDTLVQVKPGGYRWEESEAGCWQYCYRKPAYKWCKKNVQEEKITYCVETPPEYETRVETTDAVRLRTEYVPPEYEIRYVRELYRPGHWEWRATPGCDAMPPDSRCWTPPQKMGRKCNDCRPRLPALDCGCPPTN